jgi:hypothetical protein
METLIEYYDDVDPTFVGGQRRRNKSSNSNARKARGLSPKLEYSLETLVESTLINKLKAMTFEEFSKINGSKEEDYEALSLKSSSSSNSTLYSFGINDKPIMLKNATIQDKAYVSMIRSDYDSMKENYKTMIANMGTSLFKSAFNSTKNASISMLKSVGRTFKRTSKK